MYNVKRLALKKFISIQSKRFLNIRSPSESVSTFGNITDTGYRNFFIRDGAVRNFSRPIPFCTEGVTKG